MAYIDKDLLLKDIEENVVISVRSGFISPEMRGARKIIDRIETIPTADVEEVRCGEWIWTENGEEDYEQYWICSVCGEKEYFETNYCPNCGAKMDGERK